MIVVKKKSRQQRWQEKKKAEGKCIICGEPLHTKWHCKEHARLAAINNDLRNKRLCLSKKVLDGDN